MKANPVKLDGAENGSEAATPLGGDAHTTMQAQGPALSRIEEKFIRLRDEWKSQRGPISSSARLAMHPAYQTIIDMGMDVVPLLLQELETNLDQWFWALRAITEADPVSEADRGNG